MLHLPLLSINIFIPLFGALYIIVPIASSNLKKKELTAIYIALLSSSVTLANITYIVFNFNKHGDRFQFVEKYCLIDKIGLEYFLGIDGISLLFISLTAFLSLISIIISIFTIKKYIKEFLFCFLLLESFSIGAFSSLNLLLFYIFFETILIPIYLIIGMWGGNNRIYATIKFFIYTLAGSLFFFLAIIYLYVNVGTFNMLKLNILSQELDLKIQKILWLAIFFSLAIKVPIFPFHTWLIDAHVQAPTGGSIMLAGVLLKIGGYGFLRISLQMFPLVSEIFSEYVLSLSSFAVIYASLIAFTQTDMKSVIAYSSISHMGYVIGGIFSLTDKGINGAIFQMISHGIISSSLFCIMGILYDRHHTKEIAKYGGVAYSMPLLAIAFMVAVLASIGLPGLSGFIGEFFSVSGIYEKNLFIGIICTFGMVLGAVYMLNIYKRIILGPVINENIIKFKDLYLYEKVILFSLIALIFYIGIVPNIIFDIIQQSVEKLTNHYN